MDAETSDATRGPIIVIEDLNDPRVGDYAGIRDRDLLGAAGRPGQFVGETRLVVDRMLERPGMTKSVFVEQRHTEEMRERMDRAGRATVPLYTAAEPIIAGIAGFNVHRGVLAIGHRPADADIALDALPRDGSLRTLLCCEGITNIDNVGGLYRNAAAFGADAVVLSPDCHDHLYRKCLRVSMGHALSLRTARSHDWNGDLRRLKRDWGLHLIGLAIGPTAVAIDAAPLPERVAVVVGAEFAGLSDATLGLCDTVVRIPMAAGIDSLNVSVAAGIALHRFTRSLRI